MAHHPDRFAALRTRVVAHGSGPVLALLRPRSFRLRPTDGIVGDERTVIRVSIARYPDEQRHLEFGRGGTEVRSWDDRNHVGERRELEEAGRLLFPPILRAEEGDGEEEGEDRPVLHARPEVPCERVRELERRVGDDEIGRCDGRCGKMRRVETSELHRARFEAGPFALRTDVYRNYLRAGPR